jgi:hypothetical protein
MTFITGHMVYNLAYTKNLIDDRDPKAMNSSAAEWCYGGGNSKEKHCLLGLKIPAL